MEEPTGLPALPSTEFRSAGLRPPSVRVAVSMLSIYLVEGSPILLGLLRRLLQVESVQVVGDCDSSSRAIAEVTALRPDVVVVDLALREGNGFEVLQALHGLPHPPRALVLTNHATDAHREATARLGVERFFEKSTDITEMCRFIKELAESGGQGS